PALFLLVLPACGAGRAQLAFQVPSQACHQPPLRACDDVQSARQPCQLARRGQIAGTQGLVVSAAEDPVRDGGCGIAAGRLGSLSVTGMALTPASAADRRVAVRRLAALPRSRALVRGDAAVAQAPGDPYGQGGLAARG